jgi:hypothetical protein
MVDRLEGEGSGQAEGPPFTVAVEVAEKLVVGGKGIVVGVEEADAAAEREVAAVRRPRRIANRKSEDG